MWRFRRDASLRSVSAQPALGGYGGRMSTRRPVLALLGAPPGVAPPPNLDQLADLAEIRHCVAGDLAQVLPGADVLVLWDFFSRALADNWG